MAKRRYRKYRRYSPRRRYRRFRKGKQPLSLLTAIPALYSGLVQPVFGGEGYIGALPYVQSGNFQDALLEAGNILSMNFTGFSMKGPDAGQFNWQKPFNTYSRILAGWVGHKLATKAGVNRQMKKVPMIGKYIQL